MPNPAKDAQVWTRIPQTTADALERLARKRERTVAAEVRLAIKAHVEAESTKAGV